MAAEIMKGVKIQQYRSQNDLSQDLVGVCERLIHFLYWFRPSLRLVPRLEKSAAAFSQSEDRGFPLITTEYKTEFFLDKFGLGYWYFPCSLLPV